MMNWQLINEAVKLVEQIFEAEGIMENTSSIQNRTIWWYEHSEIVDSEMLAAVVIIDDKSMNWNDMIAAKEFYFPEEPLWMHNFHIGEIEEALHDFDFLMEV